MGTNHAIKYKLMVIINSDFRFVVLHFAVGGTKLEIVSHPTINGDFLLFSHHYLSEFLRAI